MKKAYLAISYANRNQFDKEINTLNDLFSKKNIELLVFVDKYNFTNHQEKKMMETAFNEIDSCDLLIAELSTKSIGVGIEIGYAFAKKIPVVYLRRKDSEYSTTASGCSSFMIEYNNHNDLQKSIDHYLQSHL